MTQQDDGPDRPPVRRARGEGRALRTMREALSPHRQLTHPGRDRAPKRRPHGVQLRGLGCRRQVYALAISRGWTKPFRLS